MPYGSLSFSYKYKSTRAHTNRRFVRARKKICTCKGTLAEQNLEKRKKPLRLGKRFVITSSGRVLLQNQAK